MPRGPALNDQDLGAIFQSASVVSSTAGNLTLRWAQNSSNTAATALLASCCLQLECVARPHLLTRVMALPVVENLRPTWLRATPNADDELLALDRKSGGNV